MEKYSEIKMIDHLKKLFPICRSITGDGIRKTLEYFERFHPEFKRLKFKTGQKVFDWEIPKEWVIRDAYIEDIESKQKYANFKVNNLHILNYSTPIDKIMEFEELSKKIHTLIHKPEVVPYLTSYYKENWGFCMEHSVKMKLKKGKYKVFIDSDLIDGSLELSHAVIRGKVNKEIMFSSYVCHPSMANNELSGPVLLNQILAYIKQEYPNPKYTYRFVLQPETIGSIAYLHKFHKKLKKKVICGFNLSCVGDDRAFSFVNTPFKDTLSDLALEVALIGLDNVRKYSFLERGSDERQYCSPGIRLPICTFCRSKFGEYEEYHTSADNFDVVNQEGLEGSFEIMKTIIDSFESNFYPKVTMKCEPQLGKRGLYPNLSNNKLPNDVKLRTNFLTFCDGSKNIFEISRILKTNLKFILEESKLLSKYGILEK